MSDPPHPPNPPPPYAYQYHPGSGTTQPASSSHNASQELLDSRYPALAGGSNTLQSTAGSSAHTMMPQYPYPATPLHHAGGSIQQTAARAGQQVWPPMYPVYAQQGQSSFAPQPFNVPLYPYTYTVQGDQIPHPVTIGLGHTPQTRPQVTRAIEGGVPFVSHSMAPHPYHSYQSSSTTQQNYPPHLHNMIPPSPQWQYVPPSGNTYQAQSSSFSPIQDTGTTPNVNTGFGRPYVANSQYNPPSSYSERVDFSATITPRNYARYRAAPGNHWQEGTGGGGDPEDPLVPDYPSDLIPAIQAREAVEYPGALQSGRFIMYQTTRLIFATTSGRAGQPSPYMHPCLVHDNFRDSFQRPSIWIVPLTSGSRRVSGKLVRNDELKANWWRPVQWYMNGQPGTEVPPDDCSVRVGPNLKQPSWREPIKLRYTKPGRHASSQAGVNIPRPKPCYLWVGDIGEAIVYDVAMRQAIVWPYYSIAAQWIDEIHAEMEFWHRFDPMGPEDTNGQPDDWSIFYKTRRT